ncbi:hypothetical protein F5887DRAFT_219033 [Amanita rubescens]|nr:hypothetical protein F5887DRAFT_219033 [Amanita rubescens]
MVDQMEPLEKLFLQVEEETERRAELESQTISLSEPTTRGEPTTSAGEPSLTRNNTATSANGTVRRRGGSVSVTRFGELSASDRKDSSRSINPSHMALYQAQQVNDSFDSFPPGSKYDDDDEEIEGDHLTTQVYGSARGGLSKAVGDLLPRRLSRSGSEQVISKSVMEPPMVVGVHVEEATVELTTEELPCATVHATNSARKRGASSGSTSSTWVEKAKDLTQKLRRRSKTVLSPPAA